MGILDGVKVVDIGVLVQAPQAAMMLGNLGADVVKVELPGLGDISRWIPSTPEDPRSPYFEGCNRGKRSATIDLRTAAGRDVFLRLVDTADVLVSNFVPGTLERWNLSYEVLAERNPRLIYAAGSTNGHLGPDAFEKGADLAAQASAGLMSTTGRDGDEPTPVAVVIADHVACLNMVNGVLAALYHRVTSGRGQRIEVSLLGGQVFAQASEYTYSFIAGEMPGRANRGHPLVRGVYGTFPTSDGHLAIVGVSSPQRSRFFEVICRPDLDADERCHLASFPPDIKRWLFDELASVFATRTTAEWCALLRAADIRVAPVRDYLEVAKDPQVWENGYLVSETDDDGNDSTVVGNPIWFSETPARVGTPAPVLGQHTEEILLELGYTWDDIGQLHADGAL